LIYTVRYPPPGFRYPAPAFTTLGFLPTDNLHVLLRSFTTVPVLFPLHPFYVVHFTTRHLLPFRVVCRGYGLPRTTVLPPHLPTTFMPRSAVLHITTTVPRFSLDWFLLDFEQFSLVHGIAFPFVLYFLLHYTAIFLRFTPTTVYWFCPFYCCLRFDTWTFTHTHFTLPGLPVYLRSHVRGYNLPFYGSILSRYRLPRITFTFYIALRSFHHYAWRIL